MEDPFWRSAVVRAMVNDRDIGGLLRAARRRRGLRQADVAAATGYSQPVISRLENGHRGVDLDVLRAVADAVAMPPRVLAALVGASPPPPVRVAPPDREDPMRRRTLMAAATLAVPLPVLTALDEALAALPDPTPPEDGGIGLAGRLARARRLHDSGDLAALIKELPDLLAAAHRHAGRHGDPAAYALAAGCYDLAAEVLSKVGAIPQSRLTADRAVLYAGMSEDPVAMAAAARSLSLVLRHEGQHALAERITLQAVNRLDRTGLTTLAQAAAYAQMLCTSAYAAARAGDRGLALELIADAQRAGTRLPEHPAGLRFPLTQPQIDLYEVGVHWALGDAGRAIEVGRHLRAGMFPTPERRARLCTDLARAWWQRGRPEETAHALLEAAGHAPAEVRDRPSIRQIVVDLTRRHPRAAGVAELAAVLGRRG